MPVMSALVKPFSFEHLPQYRAPRADSEALVDPPVSSALGAGARSLQPQLTQSISIGGISLADLRRQAKRDCLAAAIAYTSTYRNLWFDASTWLQQHTDRAWLVAGHQPELFHPGVWFKNFLLSQAAAANDAVPLNLIIDNDLCRTPAIRVLSRGLEAGQPFFRSESVWFDAPAPAVAWECRPPADLELFDSFPQRVRETLIEDIQSPLVDQLWQHARAALRSTGRLGLALAEARHRLEADIGLQTLELPLSRLCQQPSFARFSLALLQQLPRLHDIYNRQREAYRQANGLRSESHPVPALSEKLGWLEAPWWVYRSATPARKHLFAKISQGNLLLSDSAGWQATIEGPLTGEDAVAQWQEFAIDGVLLRPRALMTTMFARLAIADCFLHGIGGGKYDQLTDAIIAEFWEMAPPAMCVATATLHLPLRNALELPAASQNQLAMQHERDQLRNLRYHPEWMLATTSSEASELAAAKQALLASIPPRGEKWQWHREITRINRRLAELNQAALQKADQHLQKLVDQERQLKLAQSREFSFCLFELPHIADVLKTLAAAHTHAASAK